MTVKKHLRAQEVARANRLPCIYLVDSGGAFLPMQDEVFPDREHFGRIFFNQANLSAAGHPADRLGHGLVHRRRRLRPGDVRRDRHRQGPGHDLPRRPAAGEGRHRRGRHRRGARRRRGARPQVRRRRPPRRRRRPRPRDRPLDRRRPCRGRTAASGGLPAPSPARSRPPSPRSRRSTPTGLYDVVPTDTRTPYDVREVIRGIVDASRFHEFKELYGETLVTGFAQIWGYPVGIVANNGILFSRVGAEGRALHRAVQPAQDPAGVPAEHQRLHGRARLREPRDRPGRRQAGHGGVVLGGAEVHRGDRRLVRGGQLRDVRPRLRPALPVDVAQRPDLGDGRRAGRVGAGDRAARRHRGPRRGVARRGGGGVQGARSASSTSSRARRTTPPPGSGTTASSTRSTPAGCSAWGWRPRRTRRCPSPPTASSGCEP